MLFDGPADLPTATLRSRASEARHRVLAADLHGWLASRWRWVRPRTVPLLVAFAGMLAILGATKYLSVYAYNDDLRLRPPASITNFGGDVATNNPALPNGAAPQLQPTDGNAAVPAEATFSLDSNMSGPPRTSAPVPDCRHMCCLRAHRWSSPDLGSAPRRLGSRGKIAPDRPAPRR